MDDYMKIVNFEACRKCIHFEQDEMDDPCYECLQNPVKYASQLPLYFELDPAKAKKKKKGQVNGNSSNNNG